MLHALIQIEIRTEPAGLESGTPCILQRLLDNKGELILASIVIETLQEELELEGWCE